MSNRVETLETTVSKTNTEIEKLNNSIRLLKRLNDRMDGMNIFIDKHQSTGTLNEITLDQYEILLTEIEKSRAEFDDKYKLVRDHKYL